MKSFFLLRALFSGEIASIRGDKAHRSRKGKPAAMPFFILLLFPCLHVGAEVVRPVPVAEAVVMSPYETRTFPGEVRALQRVDLGFNVSGELIELDAAEGKRVSKGAVLARLDPRDFEYRLDNAEATYEQAKLELDRKVQLFDEKVISSSQFDQVKALYQQAEAGLNIARKALKDSELLAPFDAIISKRHVENFEQIVARRTVVSLQDISQVEVKIAIPETLIAHGKQEDVSKIEVKFEVDPTHWYSAIISEFSVQPDPITRTYEVIVRLPSPERLNIFTGMTATVRLERKNVNDASDTGSVLIPLGSVFQTVSGDSCVWVVADKPGNPELRPVTIGAPQGKHIRVLSGLSAGEWVATAGVHTLDKNSLVRPSKPNTEGLEQ